RSLSALVDKLAADEDLYSPLNEADDSVPQAVTVQSSETVDEGAPTLFKITGRGFRAEAAPEDKASTAPESADAPRDLVDRVSRYNFDELSRILNDRVGLGERAADKTAPEDATEKNVPTSTGGSLVNLGGETLVLNRLPLGILVFRDQQIL